jgi:hypothetical protein
MIGARRLEWLRSWEVRFPLTFDDPDWLRVLGIAAFATLFLNLHHEVAHWWGFYLRKCLKSDLFYQREKMVMAVTLTHESSKLSHRFD